MIKRSRGGWIVVERVPPTRDGKRIRKWVPTLADAAKLLEETAAPEAAAPDLGPTLKEFSLDFLARHEPGPHRTLVASARMKRATRCPLAPGETIRSVEHCPPW